MPTTATETIPTEYAHIVRTPGVMRGEPRIDGYRIRVRDIVAARDAGGYCPEEIATACYPQLTLAQIYAALAYFEDHREEIKDYERAETEFVEKFIREHPDIAVDCRKQNTLAPREARSIQLDNV